MTDKNQVFFTNVLKRGDNLLVRSVDTRTGERLYETIPYKPKLFMPSNNPESKFVGYRREPLEEINFDSMREADNFLERYRDVEGFRVYGQKDYGFQYLAEVYGSASVYYDASLIRRFIVDIEVFSGEIDENGNSVSGPFPEPMEALYPVSATTIYDSTTNTFYAFGLEYFNGRYLGTWTLEAADQRVKDLVAQGMQVRYFGFKEEAALLKAIVNLWHMFKPDLHSGWNSEAFDTPYFGNRVKQLIGQDWLNKMSPWGVVKSRTYNGKFGREEQTFDILGVSNLDYKEVCDKHGFFEPDDWKLGTVATMLLGEDKLSYDEAGSLNTLYVTNFQKYIDYNIVDVNLVKRIDEKKKLFNLVFALAYLMRCNYEDTLATVRPWSSFAAIDLQNHGQQPEIRAPYNGVINFVGGFVKEPRPGKRRWGVSVDFNSLYPHIMMALNLGPETILSEPEAYQMRQRVLAELEGMLNACEFQDRAYITKLINYIRAGKSIHEFYFENPIELKCLQEAGLAMAPNLSFYRKDEMSLWGRIMREVYAGRKRVKKEMLLKEQELVNAKSAGADKKTIQALENEVAGLDSLQQGYKIAMNSLYGALSNKWALEYFDLRVAEAITTTGQLAIQYGGWMINEYLNQILGTNGVDYIVTQDTDSAYIDMGAYVDAHFTPEQQEDHDLVTDHLSKFFEETMEPLFEQWFDKLVRALNMYENKFVFKREVIAPVGVWTAKKRYAMLVKDSEGVRYKEPKLKYVGLEAKKSSTPGHCRAWLVECYKISMLKDEAAIHERVKQIKAEFMGKTIEEIAAPRSVNDLEKYYDPATDGFNKGSPKHVKAALHHNKLVRDMKLKSVPEIKSGDKIKFVELRKGNPWGFETIGFSSFLPKEFQADRWVDKELTFEKNFISPLQVYLDALGWAPEPRASVMDFFL